MYLSQVKKGKSIKHKLVTDYELSLGRSQNRGLTILKAGEWTLEQLPFDRGQVLLEFVRRLMSAH